MTNPKNLELNKGDQFILALDVSGSMGQSDCPGNTRRIDYLLETVRTFHIEATKWDPDGVSFYPFGATVHAFPDLKPEDFEAKLSKFSKSLEPMTNTAAVISAAYKEHKSKGSEQTFLMVFTDGEPSDRGAVAKVITDITNDIGGEREFCIAFITVGNIAPDLEAWLTALDDDLIKNGAKYDIVDVKKLEEVDFMAAVAGALVD